MKLLSSTLFITLLASTLTSISAHATTINVPADQPTIQNAIDAAMDGDLVLVAPGTYVENIDFIDKAITVMSEEGAEVTIIDGNQAGSVVTFANGDTGTALLQGFTIRSGYALEGGGIYCEDSSSILIENCKIVKNQGDRLRSKREKRIDIEPMELK